MLIILKGGGNLWVVDNRKFSEQFEEQHSEVGGGDGDLTQRAPRHVRELRWGSLRVLEREREREEEREKERKRER